MSESTIPWGLCPICRRSYQLTGQRAVLRVHYADRQARQQGVRCAGSGQAPADVLR